MKFDVKSRHIDRDYADKTILLPPCFHDFVPVMGTTLYDDASNFCRVREYRTISVNFSEVSAYSIENAFITNEFVVHDERSLYPDSSLIYYESSGTEADHTIESLTASIHNFVDRIDTSYADQDVVVMHNEGGGTWGHHVIHNLPRILIYAKSYPLCKIAIPGSHGYANSNFGNILRLYGIGEERLVLLENTKTYQFRSVVIIDFLYNFNVGMIHPVAVELLATLPHAAGFESFAGENVFVERLSAKSRNIENRKDLADCCHLYNISMIDLGKESIESQVKVWQQAETVISTLGSDLTNMVFAKPGSRVLSLSPDWFGDNFFYHLAMAKQIQWNELRCGTVATKREPHRMSDFKVDISILNGMLRSLTRA